MNNLVWLIHNGRGIKKDIKKAIEIYECAAANGNTTAMVNQRRTCDRST